MEADTERLIKSLLVKLDTLMKTGSRMLQELQQDLLNLKECFVDKTAKRREMNLQAKAWILHVSNLVYEMEDWIDKISWIAEKGDQQMEIEEGIQNFKAQINQACELSEGCIELNTQEPAVLPSRSILLNSAPSFEKEIRLAAVDGLADEIVKLLTPNAKQVSLKVIPIYGIGGLGKNHLAKQIYTKLQIRREFECQAFVTVGQRPSMTVVLREILHQVNPSQKREGHPKIRTGNTIAQYRQALITELRNYLVTKRYFIVLDGVWNTKDWKLLNCALPNENRASRVLTTTCVSDVAKCCSVRPTDVYHMEALDDNMSRSLYLKTIQQKECPADRDEVTNKILKRCGGLPLALTVMAGLYAMKYHEEPESKMLEKDVNLSPLRQHSTSDEMVKILHMSYADMSLSLRSCFLYLSVFGENYIIRKDRLIRVWGAEGFITGDEEERGGKTKDEEITRDEKSLWETGEMYFNELITRRLIQPVFDYDDDKPVGCTVHDVILDFIRSLSSEGNFVTLGSGLNSGLFPGSTNTVRRFSLDCYNDEHQDEDGTLASVAVHLSRVRSITVLGDIEGMDGRSALTVSGKIEGRPVLPFFKHIRVLDLEDTHNLGSRHLEGIGGLVLLKHLGIAGTEIDKLPEEIGELGQLETLDLRHTKLRILPVSIAKQKRLAHLLIEPCVEVPEEILEIEALVEVAAIGVDSSSSIDSVVELLRKSERLRVLGVRLDGSRLTSDIKSVRSFLREVTRSTKLTSLSLDCLHIGLVGILLESPPSDQLRRFELKISVPLLVGTAHKMASLVSVTHIDIEIIQLEDGAVRVLGGLPNVVLVKLVSTGVTKSRSGGSIKRRCTVGVDHGFKRLQVFSFTCRFGGTELQFTAGAMPELRRLSLCFIALETLSLYGNFSFGIEHLSSLTRVRATIDCDSARASAVKNAEDAIRRQAGNISTDRIITTEFNKIHENMIRPDHKVKTARSYNISTDAFILPSLRELLKPLWSLVHIISRPVSGR